jgi:hypothetical protein
LLIAGTRPDDGRFNVRRLEFDASLRRLYDKLALGLGFDQFGRDDTNGTLLEGDGLLPVFCADAQLGAGANADQAAVGELDLRNGVGGSDQALPGLQAFAARGRATVSRRVDDQAAALRKQYRGTFLRVRGCGKCERHGEGNGGKSGSGNHVLASLSNRNAGSATNRSCRMNRASHC